MALSIHALTTWETMQAELGLSGTSDQTVIERLINAASEEIERVAQRHFEYVAGHAERVAGHGTNLLIVSHAPIRSVAAIDYIDGAGLVSHSYASTEYAIHDAKAGLVAWTGGTDVLRGNVSGWPWTADAAGDTIRGEPLPGSERKALRVVYDGGWVTPEQARANTGMARDLPYDLEQACIIAVASWWKRRGSDVTVSNHSSAQGSSVTYRAPAEGNSVIGTIPSGMLPLEAAQIAQRYRRVV